MKYTLVDSHAHLDGSKFTDDLDQVIQRASENDVEYILTIGCDLESSRKSIDLALRYPNIYASVGIHPHDAANADDKAIEELRQMATSIGKVVAIGETGLDFFRDNAPRPAQREAFRKQVRLARDLKLPLIIHDRDAHDETVAILKDEKASDVGGVLHCFSGNLKMARACIDLGFYISFPGTLTYPKNDELRAIARALPIDVALVETDCPYLAPQKWRGKRNEPAYVRTTAELLAEIKGLTFEDVARVTSLNTHRLFGIGRIDQSAKIAYVIRHSLYLNITNRCTNKCTFCAKFRDFTVKGHQLCLEHEPDLSEVIAAIGDPAQFDEVVFCGYGEPLLRLDLVKEIAAWLKKEGKRVRINSDGQANLVYGRNILPELSSLVDAISISLNAADATTYQKYCQSDFGEKGYEAIRAFLVEAKKTIPSVTATAVALPGLDIDACRKVADELGVAFRPREYNDLG
ncbi:MAG: radical SAM protein [Desulfuromonas sp.]|nr:MAG: radical SAM protein [Desulfuromonas sp.]